MFTQEEFFNGIHESCTGHRYSEGLFSSKEGQTLLTHWDTGLFTAVKVTQDLDSEVDYVFTLPRNLCPEEDARVGVRMRVCDGWGHFSVAISTFGCRDCKMEYRNNFLHLVPINRTIAHLKTLVEVACQNLSLKDLRDIDG